MTTLSTPQLVDLLLAEGVCAHVSNWEAIVAAVQKALGSGLLVDAPAPEISVKWCEERWQALGAVGAEAAAALVVKLRGERLGALREEQAALRAKVAELKPEKVGGRKGARAPASLDAPLEDSWADYADDEEKKTKRTNTTPLSETLLKMHASITKHKYAAPFKRPVTEKEAPDYHEVIKNPMDLQTLKKLLESGEVATVDALVEKLVLIFDNTLEYNAKGSDLYKIGVSLKALVQKERELYHERRAQIDAQKAGGSGAPVVYARARVPTPGLRGRTSPLSAGASSGIENDSRSFPGDESEPRGERGDIGGGSAPPRSVGDDARGGRDA